MARTQARIFTSIWHDRDFLARTAGAQRLYMLALSQDGMSFCGVVDFTATRWATLARDTPVAAIRKQVAELVKYRFVMVDDVTEELWARTLVKWDRVLKSPNLIPAVVRDFDAVHSQPIRDAIRQYMRDQMRDGIGDGLPKGVSERVRDDYHQRFGEPVREPVGNGSRVHGAGPSASSLLSLPSSSSYATNAHPVADPVAVEAQGDDDDEGISTTPAEPPTPAGGEMTVWEQTALMAVQRLARRDLDRREAERGPVGDDIAWLRKAIDTRIARHAGQLQALDLAAYVGRVDALVQLLDPAPASGNGHGPMAGPLDRVVAAAKAKAARNDAPACPTCETRGGGGKVFREDGLVEPCPDCAVTS